MTIAERSNTRRTMITTAQRAVRKVPRPEGVSSAHWLSVQQCLLQLASHLPNVWPSQEYVAKHTGLGLRTVRRALQTAEEHNLIERYSRKPGGRRTTPGYQLLWLTDTPVRESKLTAETGQNGHSETGQVGRSETGQNGRLSSSYGRRVSRSLRSQETSSPGIDADPSSPKVALTAGGRTLSPSAPQPPPYRPRETRETPAVAKRPSKTPQRKRNKKAERCGAPGCTNYVGAGKGYLLFTDRWHALCIYCDAGFPLGTTKDDHDDAYRRYRPPGSGHKRILPRRDHDGD